MGFIIGLCSGLAIATALTYIAQHHDQSRFPAWLSRFASPWKFD